MTIQSCLRLAWRLLTLLGIIATGLLIYPLFLRRDSSDLFLGKISWMQWMSRRFLRLLGCKVTLRGNIPSRGLIACNHLGYVDILVIGSICPTVFIAKSDVKQWPIFGWLASLSGTLFVSRNAPTKVIHQIEEISALLTSNHPIVLFPEGTSSDGTRVLPFRSSLLQAPLATGQAITPAAVQYVMANNKDTGTTVAYWGTMSFLPHLLALMTNRSFTAHITFGQTRIPSEDRKKEALQLHTEVSNLLNS